MWYLIAVFVSLVFPPFILVAIALLIRDIYLWWKRDEIAAAKLAKHNALRPCPRCANTQVTMYLNGYFTCGWCPARGRYPFNNRSDLDTRLATMMVGDF